MEYIEESPPEKTNISPEDTVSKLTAFEHIQRENKDAKASGLSKEDAIHYEAKECSKALHAALFGEDVGEDQHYSTIQEHIHSLLSIVNTVDVLYA